MKPTLRPDSALIKRFKAAAALRRTKAEFAQLLRVERRRVILGRTRHSFTFAEIAQLDRQITRRAKIAQSDVPDNMLALLTALRASTGPIPS